MTRTTNRPAFALNAGHPVLDLVNTLDNRFLDDGPVELLMHYGDLLRFMQQSGLLSAARARLLAAASRKGAASRGAAARALRSARELREAMAAVLYGAADGSAPARAHIRTLQRYFLGASRHRQLYWRQPSKPSLARPRASWAWGRFEAAAALPVWVLSQAAAELVSSNALDRLRTCGSETCRWLFLDTSKNHSRRWCDMKICGNRMKARRFHARRQA